MCSAHGQLARGHDLALTNPPQLLVRYQDKLDPQPRNATGVWETTQK